MIEVSLFLAITGLLFIGIAAGVQNSIFQQRYNDSVQNFVEFLRTTYSEVTNVEHIGGGNSDLAVYGRLVVFGTKDDTNDIKVYDMVGGADVGDGADGSVLGILAWLRTSVPVGENVHSIIEEYKPRWGAVIQKADKNSFEPFSGALLIVRNPETGVVYTYEYVGSADDLAALQGGQVLDPGDFSLEQVDFCINPDGAEGRKNRQDVRIVKGARNSSGIEIVPTDSGDNECNN